MDYYKVFFVPQKMTAKQAYIDKVRIFYTKACKDCGCTLKYYEKFTTVDVYCVGCCGLGRSRSIGSVKADINKTSNKNNELSKKHASYARLIGAGYNTGTR